MPINTVNDLIAYTLKGIGVIGVGQTAQAEDLSDAFSTLQMLMGQWQRRRWLIWHLIDVAKVSTGAQSYTIGPGMDFSVPRPDRIEAAFVRQTVPTQPSTIDYPLRLLEAREDYNDIALKTMPSFPQWIFYDAAFPTGFIYPWPVPPASIYEIHLSLKEQLVQFTGPAQVINLPPEYLEALWSNLALRLALLYGVQVNPAVAALATASLAVVRGANAQIPRLKMPRDLNRTGGIYNIYADS